MATLFQDLFTDVNATALESHTPNTGTGWDASLITNGYSITGNQAQLEVGAGGCHLCTGITATDYEVSADVQSVGTGRHGFSARVTDVNNGVFIRFRPDTDAFIMNKRVATTVTTIATSTADVIADSTLYALRLRVEGTGASQNFDGYFSGTLRLNPAAPNDAVLDTGRPGMGILSGNDGETNNIADNFLVEDFVVAGRVPYQPWLQLAPLVAQ